jgi:hypothetical protein
VGDLEGFGLGVGGRGCAPAPGEQQGGDSAAGQEGFASCHGKNSFWRVIGAAAQNLKSDFWHQPGGSIIMLYYKFLLFLVIL